MIYVQIGSSRTIGIDFAYTYRKIGKNASTGEPIYQPSVIQCNIFDTAEFTTGMRATKQIAGARAYVAGSDNPRVEFGRKLSLKRALNQLPEVASFQDRRSRWQGSVTPDGRWTYQKALRFDIWQAYHGRSDAGKVRWERWHKGTL